MNKAKHSNTKKVATPITKAASDEKAKTNAASKKQPVKDMSIKLFTFKGPHIKQYFDSEPGTEESEMEIIGKVNKKKRALRRIRRRSIEQEPEPELKRVKRGKETERR